jgi:translation initiation factor IF-1
VAVVVANTAAAAAAVVVIAINWKTFAERGLDHPRPRSFCCFLPALAAGRKHSPKKFKATRMNNEKEQHIEIEGVVSAVLPGTMFRVELANKHIVLATICGKMRKRWVRIATGDRVKMEMSPYDLNKARITWRLR